MKNHSFQPTHLIQKLLLLSFFLESVGGQTEGNRVSQKRNSMNRFVPVPGTCTWLIISRCFSHTQFFSGKVAENYCQTTFLFFPLRFTFFKHPVGIFLGGRRHTKVVGKYCKRDSHSDPLCSSIESAKKLGQKTNTPPPSKKKNSLYKKESIFCADLFSLRGQLPNQLFINFRLSSDAEILSLSTDWSYKRVPNMQKRAPVCNVYIHTYSNWASILHITVAGWVRGTGCPREKVTCFWTSDVIVEKRNANLKYSTSFRVKTSCR